MEVQRNSRVGKIIVDNGLEVVNGTSPGTFSSLNTNSGYLFIGGIPSMMSSRTAIQQVTGCTRSIL